MFKCSAIRTSDFASCLSQGADGDYVYFPLPLDIIGEEYLPVYADHAGLIPSDAHLLRVSPRVRRVKNSLCGELVQNSRRVPLPLCENVLDGGVKKSHVLAALYGPHQLVLAFEDGVRLRPVEKPLVADVKVAQRLQGERHVILLLLLVFDVGRQPVADSLGVKIQPEELSRYLAGELD